MGEWTKREESNVPDLNAPLANDTSWYVAAGWHFGKWTPLAMYSVLNITESAIEIPASYHTWDASFRYDVVRNLDLKLQVSRDANEGLKDQFFGATEGDEGGPLDVGQQRQASNQAVRLGSKDLGRERLLKSQH
jgi:hypothetical protein